MTNLFLEDGHLCDEAFDLLSSGAQLDELSRLEIAEHLAFCDLCVDRYTAYLEPSELLTPQEPAVPGVIRRLRQKAVKLFYNRYVTAVAAAAFAIVFWNLGFFTPEYSFDGKLLDRISETRESISETVTTVGNNVAENINDFFNQIYERGNTDHE